MDLVLHKEALSTRLMWVITELGGPLSQDRRAHLHEVESSLMDSLLQISDTSKCESAALDVP